MEQVVYYIFITVVSYYHKRQTFYMAERTVEIPNGIEIRKEGKTLVVRGPKGELKRDFVHGKINIELKGRQITVSSEEDRKRINAVLGTWQAHIKNMVVGVQKGWKCEMRLVFSHFPAKMSFKDSEFTIQNFLGERAPRSTRLPPGINVKIDKENITLAGSDKEIVGQAAGKIEKATKIVGYDRRIFQDGCFITKHPYAES